MVEVGDVVLAFDGHPVSRSSDLPPIVGSTPVGTRVPVDILREGQAIQLHVLTAELPEEEAIQLAVAPASSKDTATKLGLTVTDLNDEQRTNLDVPENGVLVKEVVGEPAIEAGFQPGDVILMLNAEHVLDSESFAELVDALPKGKAARVLVQRKGSPIFIPLSVE